MLVKKQNAMPEGARNVWPPFAATMGVVVKRVIEPWPAPKSTVPTLTGWLNVALPEKVDVPCTVRWPATWKSAARADHRAWGTGTMRWRPRSGCR